MSLSASILPEFDQEMATTRRVLARVADERLTWKPHQRSSTMGGLATHLANLPTWAAIALGGDSFDAAPPIVPPDDES